MIYHYMYGIKEAYYEVVKEMCKLLNADIILKEYHIWLLSRPESEILRQYQYYINSLWRIILKSKDDDALHDLALKVSDLLIEGFIFVFDEYVEL